MSTSPDVLRALRRVEAQIAQKKLRTGVLKLADALCFTYCILPEGKEYVLAIQSDPRVRDNREAVAAWVEEQLINPGPEMTAGILPVLVSVFAQKMRSIYEGVPCD